jgi:hypothetical protein
MKCFYHAQVDAVAVCKNCGRGLCPGCAVDLGNGTACRGRCEAEVQALVELQQRSKTGYQKAASAAGRTALWLSLTCLAFVAAGLVAWNSGGGMLLFFGAVFLLGAVFSYITARRFRRVD